MKMIILALFLSTQANAMTVAQANQKVAEVMAKQNKTKKDIVELKEALAILSSKWAPPTGAQ